MDPVDALSRIAYVLETTGAETYKVRAFRNAAQALSGMSKDDIERLATNKRLTDVPGIGKTTAEVVVQALAGITPTYLEAIDFGDDGVPALGERAQEIRDALRGDCHCHSDWSDGGSPIEEMARAAQSLGHDYLVLTDHSGSLTIAHGLDRERLAEQLGIIEQLNTELAPFRVLTGIEVDILEDGRLDQDDDLLEQLDVVVASVHSKLRMESPAMTKRMIAAIENPRVDILGHCTGRIIAGKGRPESTFDHDAIADACARTGTAIEINSRPERRDPPPQLLKLVIDHGCLVSIDTDAHAPGQLEWLGNGCEQAAEAKTETSHIVNTWPLENLLEWTGSHQS